ncbi:MAG: hypothetical protein Hens3KO_17370 [Henriciella sp.]
MAKKDSKKKQKKKAQKAKAKFVGTMLEAKGIDVAHKIWLAGVGAYGKAYDVASDGAGKVSEQSSVVFEDLVKRGEEIDGDVRKRLASNTAVLRMAEQMGKVNERVSKVRGRMAEATEDVTETVTKFQEEQRVRLEARMERMRDALGLDQFTGKTKKAEKLHAKLDDLEEQVASLKANSEGIDDKVKARVERLSAEIAGVGAKAKKVVKAATKKPAAKKVVAKKVAATKPVAKKAAVKAAAKPKAKPAANAKPVAKAAPAVDANGRLKKAIGTADDLKMIKGVGPALEARLNKAGVFHFKQIAGMTKAQLNSLEAELDLRGRPTRDGWKVQARALSKAAA